MPPELGNILDRETAMARVEKKDIEHAMEMVLHDWGGIRKRGEIDQ
jgi:hypothetical protein